MGGLKLSEARAIKVDKDTPTIVLFKNSYEQDDWQEAVVIKRKTIDFNGIQLKHAFPKSPGLDKAKKDGLLKLIEKKVIPTKHQLYYSSL